MEGFGPMFIMIGCFLLMNSYGKMKRNKARFANRYKNTNTSRIKRKNTGKYRDARNK